jgi:CoA-dependent NAD(P)H sulfur oxidoreductase
MTRLVVVGGNAAGMSAASRAKRRNPDLEVVVYESGDHISYSACGIPHLVQGAVEEPEQLLVLSDEKAADRGMEVIRRSKAVGFNAYTKEVTIQGPDGRDSTHYDKLCIATGVEAANPFKGGDLNGVFTLRHLQDGIRLMNHVDSGKCKEVAVVGAGYLGMEMAEAFKKRDCEVHLIARGPRLLPQMDPQMTDGLTEFIMEKGINVHVDTDVKSFAEGKRAGSLVVHTKGAGDLRADAVLVAVGTKPNTTFATKGGVHALSSGHILVDDSMRTNLHDVWAAGDCVAPRHIVTGRPTAHALALPSNRMGRVAGDSIAASTERIPGPSLYFPGVLGTTITRLFGLAFAQTGLTESRAKKEGLDPISVLIEAKSKAAYLPTASDMAIKMVAEADTGKLLGVELAGPAEAGIRINAAAVALQSGLTVKKLAEIETAYAPDFSTVWDPMLIAASQLAKEVRR